MQRFMEVVSIRWPAVFLHHALVTFLPARCPLPSFQRSLAFWPNGGLIKFPVTTGTNNIATHIILLGHWGHWLFYLFPDSICEFAWTCQYMYPKMSTGSLSICKSVWLWETSLCCNACMHNYKIPPKCSFTVREWLFSSTCVIITVLLLSLCIWWIKLLFNRD